MVKAIIWDMDGVIVDSEHHHHEGEIATFKHFGVDVPEEVNKQYKGAPLNEHFQGLKDRLNVGTPLEELLAKQNEFIQNMYTTKAETFKNVKEVLVGLNKKYKQALATSTERRFVEIVLKRFGLENIFSVITCGDEVTRGKPEPDIFLKTAEKLNINPGEIVVIEDSLNGIKAGTLAGMTVIAHKAHHNQDIDFSQADFIVEDLSQVPGILERA